MSRNIIETGMGAIVILVAVLFLVFSYSVSDLRPAQGYDVIAKFNAVDGLTVGSDVRVAGVKVGTVVGERIDQSEYRAVVTMKINDNIELADDTAVRISSAGILGGKYVKLEPGSSKQMLQSGGELTNTKDVISLEELLGKVIFLVTGDEGGPK
ncbi:MAG: outer membrane lipid asymmetry maintenance protein MlaD [Alphaproteobacteria bacterium]|nr:outer membrane lipid asymmetry maintenance protein MlaD [Alphaproteobacteria bacterium]